MLIRLTKDRELEWIYDQTIDFCRDLKHGLDDCYALLAPIDPGSTLVMSTPRNEKVKGTITRVGTRIVKASLSLQLRTIPPQVLALSQSHAIHIQPLDALHTHLTQSVDLLGLILSRSSKATPAAPLRRDAVLLSSNLSLLADSLAESISLLKGPPLTDSDPAWLTRSIHPSRFAPPLGPHVSFHVGLQDSCIVLWLRALEPVHAPVHFGTKLGLAIGTVRRLEHDEMDVVFRYKPGTTDDCPGGTGGSSARHSPDPTRGQSLQQQPTPPQQQTSHHHHQLAADDGCEEVYVREKVRVESADPSLISLYSKLGYLSNTLAQARRNLAQVLGTEWED